MGVIKFQRMSYLDLPEFQDIKNNVLINYLSPYDFYKVNPSEELIEKCFVHHIISRLQNILKDKYDDFMNKLDQENAVISGSFLIECFYGTSFEKSDIDTLYQKLDASKRSIDDCFLSELFQYDMDNDEEYNYENNLRAFSHRNYKFNDKRIQGIEYALEALGKKDYIDKIWKHVVDNYDFDICMNIFYLLNGKPYIKIYNLDGLIKRSINLCKINIYTRKRRTSKYKSRGFTINYKTEIKMKSNDDTNRLIILNKLEKGNSIYDALGDEEEGQSYVEEGIYEIIIDKWNNNRKDRVNYVGFYNPNIKDLKCYIENLYYL